ncbi:MAG: diheme cytochrome c-553 [Lewinellaceae bacterium]|nr:diheme cytochrome c-553 [Saprospiraceae bacterium]MCB9337535.1 diheme cytochrome c-553 [Lewinellaceae bacterium]
MKTISITASLLFMGLFFTNCTQDSPSLPNPEAVQSTAMTPEMKVKRGEYLVNSIGCDDCHSPKVMGPNGPEIDPKRRLSGHPSDQPLTEVSDKSVLKDYALFNMSLTAAVGPWGTSFAANLTPDDTGLGNWSEEQFVRAIRQGLYKGLEGSRPLLPPMPWPTYKNMTDDDLKSIFAYLQTLPPVKNAVPAAVPPAS